MDMACHTAESESHRPREFSPENRMTPPARSLVAQLSGVNFSVLSLAPSSSVILLASSNDVCGTNDIAEPPAPAADVPRISGPVESPAPADGGVRTTGLVGISAPMPPQHNPILALFAFMNGTGALPASDPIIGPDRRPGLYHRPSKTQTLAASLLRYYANPLRRQQVFTAVLGVSIDIYLLDAFLTTPRADAFTVDSLNGLLSLDVVTKLNACAWTSLPAVEKDAVDLLWRHCVKDELPVIYYAVTLGFGDVIVGQEEFAALFAGSLYLYQQHGPDWLPTREQLKQAGEALIDALVNETLEIQMLGYLSLPALFFAGQHMRPMPLNAQQAANMEYKLEAVVQFKQFWRKRMTVLKSANAQLRLYAQSVANGLLARGQATFTAEASSEARISQEEGDTPACGALIADATPVAGRQTPGALVYGGVNAAMSGDAKAVAEHFCIIDRTLLVDAFACLAPYDAGQFYSDNTEIHEIDVFISEKGDYRSRNAYPHLTLQSSAENRESRFATLKQSVDLLAIREVTPAGKADHYKHIYALQFQQSHYTLIRLDFDAAAYMQQDLFDIRIEKALFEGMRSRAQLVLNLNIPHGREKIIKPAGHAKIQYLIGYLQRKHRDALYALLHAAAVSRVPRDLATIKLGLPLYASINAVMAEENGSASEASCAIASAIPAIARVASLSARVDDTTLKAYRATANSAGNTISDGEGAVVMPGAVLPSRLWTINLGQDLLRLGDPGLNVLSSAGCASYAQAAALLKKPPQPLTDGPWPPAISGGMARPGDANRYDFKCELPDYALKLPMKVIGRQQHNWLLTLVNVDNGEQVGRHYVCVAHHLIPVTDVSGVPPAAAAEAGAEGTLVPAAPALPGVNKSALAPVVTGRVSKQGSFRVMARTAAARSPLDGRSPSRPRLILRLKRPLSPASDLTYAPALRLLKSFMPPREYAKQRFDTSYVNFCGIVKHYPDAHAFYQHGLTQPYEGVPEDYHQLRNTLPYFVNEVALARQYAHDLLAQFPLGKAFCAVGAASFHPVMDSLAQMLKTRDKAILQQASVRLGWYLSKINHYFDHYSDAIKLVSLLPASNPAHHHRRATGFAHTADSERRCYIMVDDFIAQHFQRADALSPQSASRVDTVEGFRAPPDRISDGQRTGSALPDKHRELNAVASDYLDLYRQTQGDPDITVEQFISAINRDEMLRANLIMEDKKRVAILIADLAHARHGALHPKGQRPFMLGERQASTASPAFLGMLYAMVLIFDDGPGGVRVSASQAPGAKAASDRAGSQYWSDERRC